MPYLYGTTSDLFELVFDLDDDEKKELLNELLKHYCDSIPFYGNSMSFDEKINQITFEIIAVEHECLNVELPESVHELLYKLTGREIGKKT